ncbi:MAG: maleylacetoacetate isomerase [Cellvibrionales bacterium]|nr:maleylacetoacetate isomerase [Cellvibrionales bacterium]
MPINKPKVMDFCLHNYHRSSAAYRVRIALALKNIPSDTATVNLLDGQQQSPEYLAINPQGLVPALCTESHVLTQSLAIIEYLNERYPSPALLPEDLLAKAQVRAMAQQIAIDIHPLNNLRVLNYLKDNFNCSDSEKTQWISHWITQGFAALEKTLAAQNKDVGSSNNAYCFGSQPSLADICLIPQVYNAKRFGVAMQAYPNINAIVEHCNRLPAFITAAPN